MLTAFIDDEEIYLPKREQSLEDWLKEDFGIDCAIRKVKDSIHYWSSAYPHYTLYPTYECVLTREGYEPATLKFRDHLYYFTKDTDTPGVLLFLDAMGLDDPRTDFKDFERFVLEFYGKDVDTDEISQEQLDWYRAQWDEWCDSYESFERILNAGPTQMHELKEHIYC